MKDNFEQSIESAVSNDPTRVAIVQSNYIPWRGYFDLIASVEHFVLFDDVQYTKRDWRNRNLIKTPQGLQWLTVPVNVKGKYSQLIREVELNEHDWVEKHLKSIELNYKKANHFVESWEFVSSLFSQVSNESSLSKVNESLIRGICDFLGIQTQIHSSNEFEILEGKNERLIQICTELDADIYVSGPSAAGYMETNLFKKSNLDVEWFEYPKYQEYPQLWGEFEQGVSILDLLFNCGQGAKELIPNLK